MIVAYIGIGANMEDPFKQIRTALINLSMLPQTEYINCSSFYQSQPLGPSDQSDYINAVAAIKTALLPKVLLKALQRLEEKQGRRRVVRWGPRIIDLDILLYGNLIIQSDELYLPHQGLFLREFVLYPLAEIVKDLIFPTGESILEVKAKCPTRGIKKIIKSPFLNKSWRE